MVGLIDIAPAVETVDVQGAPVAVHGVSAKGIAQLLGRFPELRMLMTGQQVETEQLMAMGGDAVAAIIAAGCGYPGDETAEAVAGKLSLDAQADLLAAILRLTLPRGIGPFVEKLTALGGILGRRSIRYGAGFEIAEAVDALIGADYPPTEVWAMTPREIAGSLHLRAADDVKRDAAEQLAAVALAARGEPRELKRQLEQLQRCD